jgi:hypothetical protein
VLYGIVIFISYCVLFSRFKVLRKGAIKAMRDLSLSFLIIYSHYLVFFFISSPCICITLHTHTYPHQQSTNTEKTCSIFGRCRYISRLRAEAVSLPLTSASTCISTPEISGIRNGTALLYFYSYFYFYSLLKEHAFIFVVTLVSFDAIAMQCHALPAMM